MTVHALRPERCPCGNTTFALTRPYHTHQVLELPPLTIDVTHWVSHQGWRPACGRWSKVQVPAEPATGYGPRFSALMGERAGIYSNGRRMVQTFCASVLQIPISLGAIPAVLILRSAGIDLRFELKTPDHERHPVLPTIKDPIPHEGLDILAKRLAPGQHTPPQLVLLIAPLEHGVEQEGQ